MRPTDTRTNRAASRLAGAAASTRDNHVVWMTEEEMLKLMRPSALGRWLIWLSAPAGMIAAQFLWWIIEKS